MRSPPENSPTLSAAKRRRNDVFRCSPIGLSVVLALALGGFGCRDVILDTLIFMPSRATAPPPPGVVERSFVAADGVRLAAFYVPPPSAAAPVLVWAHGNAGNVSMRADVLVALALRGLGVLAFDYRGYGKSEGRPSVVGVVADAIAAYDHLRAEGVEPTRIVAFGESLGGAVAIELALQRPCAALILLSTFTSLSDVGRHHYGALAAVLGRRLASVDRIGEVRIPALFLHGDQDEIVPFALGERLFAAANQPKRFVRVTGAMHNDVFAHPAVIDAIAAFARESVGEPS